MGAAVRTRLSHEAIFLKDANAGYLQEEYSPEERLQFVDYWTEKPVGW